MKPEMKKKSCNDKHCPTHSSFSIHGRKLIGTVKKLSAHKTIKIEFERLRYMPKYERYERRKTKLLVHCPPCIKVKIGDKVQVMECRPISKAKNFVVIKNEST